MTNKQVEKGKLSYNEWLDGVLDRQDGYDEHQVLAHYAPELLEACKFGLVIAKSAADGGDMFAMNYINVLEYAIAKAEGW